MELLNRINQAVDYIEETLYGELSEERLAQIAGCSVYNFQRMFSYIANMSLSEYIRSRRLTLAAFEVVNTKESILSIALRYGYDSHDSFTRAFQRFHGVLPSAARAGTVQLKSLPKISFQIKIQGEKVMNYQIEKWPAFTTAGFKTRVKTAEVYDRVPVIWQQAWQDGSIQKLFDLCAVADSRPSGLLGIAAGGQWGNSEEMDYYLSVTTHVDDPFCKAVEVPSEMVTFEFPEATWAIFDASGELPGAVQEIYQRFYTEWLPNSGYGLADLPAVECYMQENRQEVWIALTRDEKLAR